MDREALAMGRLGGKVMTENVAKDGVLRILMSADCPSDPNLGVPGVMHSLAEEYRKSGHEVRMRFRDTPGRLGGMLFGWKLSRSADVAWADVVDSHAVDAWPLCSRRIRPVVVARSHGLELSMHRKFVQANQAGQLRLGPIYWLYRGSLRLRFERNAVRRADATLVLNESDRRICLDELGGDPSRVHLVPNGFPPGFLSRPAKKTCGVAFVGSWLARKGNDVAVRAIGEILRARPEQTILLAGTGVPERDLLADFPEDLRDRLVVRSKFERRDLPDLLEDRGILLFPSRSEGYPLSLVEAMACGLVPVASRIPGVVEVVEDGISGRLVETGDASGFAEAVLGLQRDPVRLAALGSGARDRIRSTGWDAIARSQLALYHALHRGRVGS